MRTTIFIIFISFLGCHHQSKSNIETIEDLIKTLENDSFIENYKDYRVLPVKRGLDKIYVKLKDWKSNYYENFYYDYPQKLRIVNSVNLLDRLSNRVFKDSSKDKKELLEVHSLLKKLKDYRLVSIRERNNFFHIYTDILDKTRQKKYVLIYAENEFNTNKLFDLDTKLLNVKNNWYLYSSDLY